MRTCMYIVYERERDRKKGERGERWMKKVCVYMCDIFQRERVGTCVPTGQL